MANGKNGKRKPQKYSDNAEKKASRERSLANLKPFQTGYDPRRNYHGRPRDIDQLRELIRDIGENEVELRDGGKVSRLFLKVMQMFDSGDPRDNALILAYGFGKVPEELNVRNLSDEEILRRTKDVVSRIGALLNGDATARLDPGIVIESEPLDSAQVAGEAVSRPSDNSTSDRQ